MLLYKYFRVINNVIDDLSLFIVQKSLKTKYNGELYSYLFILDNISFHRD